MSIFSERLTALLKERNISQKELSEQVGVTQSAMSYYVKGLRLPHGNILSKIATALNTTTDYLLGKDIDPDNKLFYIQRNLQKLDPEQLKKAENILKSVFDDIFEDEEE